MNIFTISGLLIGFSSLVFGIFVLIKGKKNHINQLWSIFTLAVAIWGFGGYKVSLTTDYSQALLWWRFTYIGIIFIPVLFYHFVYLFLELKKKIILYLIYLFGFFFFFLMWTSWADIFFGLNNITFLFNSFYWVYPPTYLFTFFFLCWFGIIIYAHYKLYQVLRRSSGLKHNQIKYFFLATAVGFSGGSISFLPCFGIEIYPYLNLSVPLYPVIMSYAIVKYELLDIRVFAARVLIVILNLIAFTYIFISETFGEYVIKTLFFLGVLFVSYLLKKSFDHEIKQRQELDRLANKLKKANTKLMQLDKAKSEFISIASHQLRTPLSSIKGFVSLLLEGTYGEVNDDLKKILKKVYTANDHLVVLVNDLLNLSRMESGKMKYDFKYWKIEDIIREVAEMLFLKAEDKGIYLKTILPSSPLPKIKMDKSKISEVFSNLIENSIKYTKEGGTKISFKIKNDKVRIIVSDTGIGIDKNDQSRLFSKFSRGENMRELDTEGTGLGLYVGKKMIEEHHGRIWAESEGKGKGSKFVVELPLDFDKIKEWQEKLKARK